MRKLKPSVRTAIVSTLVVTSTAVGIYAVPKIIDNKNNDIGNKMKLDVIKVDGDTVRVAIDNIKEIPKSLQFSVKIDGDVTLKDGQNSIHDLVTNESQKRIESKNSLDSTNSIMTDYTYNEYNNTIDVLITSDNSLPKTENRIDIFELDVKSNSSIIGKSNAPKYKVVPNNPQDYKYLSNTNKEYTNLGVVSNDETISMNIAPTITLEKPYVQVEEGKLLELNATNLNITMNDLDGEDNLRLEVRDIDKSGKPIITEFKKDTPGVYNLECVALDSYNEKSEAIIVQVNVVLEKVTEKPIITKDNKKLEDITISAGDIFKPLDNVKAVDAKGRELEVKLSVDKELDLDPEIDTTYTLTYTAIDIYGNKASEDVKLTVLANKAPVIKGVKDHTIKVGDKFDPEDGVSIEDEDKDIKLDITSNVNTNIAGEYKVSYSATDSKGKTSRAQSKVTVNPKVSGINNIPTITAGDKAIKVGDTFTDKEALQGVSAKDKEDGDITSKIKVVENNVNTSKEGIYTVKYSVEDSQGAKASKEIKVTVNLKVSGINNVPTITVSDKVIKVGDAFTDKEALQGVSAKDKEDGDITSKIKVIENNVNTSKEGIYTVKYSVEDSQGAKATKEIKVTVNAKDSETVLAKDITIKNKFDKLYINANKILTADINKEATIRDINWTTSDNNIASIEVLGNSVKINAKSKGSVTITAKTIDGSNKSDSINIDILDFKDNNDVIDSLKDIVDSNIVLPISGNGNESSPLELEVKEIKSEDFSKFANKLKKLNALVESTYEDGDFTVYKIILSQKTKLFKRTSNSYIELRVNNKLKNSEEIKNILNNISNQAPQIVIEGLKTTINVGDKFDKLDGVSATDFEDGNITKDIKVIGEVDTSKVGKYELTYEVSDSNGAKTHITVVINVIEKANPEVPQDPDNEETPVEPGKPGTPGESEQPELPIVPDNKINAPIIKISSTDNVIYVGNKFDVVQGVSAYDVEDGDLTSSIEVSGNVDTSKSGKYTLVYTVEDSDGNKTTISRIITVSEKENTNINNPQTGDSSIIGYIGLGSLAIGGLILNKRRNK